MDVGYIRCPGESTDLMCGPPNVGMYIQVLTDGPDTSDLDAHMHVNIQCSNDSTPGLEADETFPRLTSGRAAGITAHLS